MCADKPISPGVDTGQIREEQETALPELELKLIVRGNEVCERISSIESIFLWKNFTLIILPDSDDIFVLDSEGKTVNTIVGRLNINWFDIFLKVSGYGNAIGVLDIENAPFTVRSFLRKVGKKKDYIYYNDQSLKLQSGMCFKSINVSSDSRYVVLSTEAGIYRVFVTQDEAGVFLPPEKWKVFDETYTKEMPEDFLPMAQELERKIDLDATLSPDGKYRVVINSLGINFIDTASGKSVFSYEIPGGVKDGYVFNPTNFNEFFFCSDGKPGVIYRLDKSGDPKDWKVTEAKFKKQYPRINKLSMDPSGEFFVFYTGKEMVILSKETMDEVKSLPGIKLAVFDQDGRIRAIDSENRLIIYEPDFEALKKEIEKRRLDRLKRGVDLGQFFRSKKKGRKGVFEEVLPDLEDLLKEYLKKFQPMLDQVTSVEEAQEFRQSFEALKIDLRANGLKTDEANFIIKGLDAELVKKEQVFAAKEGREIVAQLQASLAGGLSFTSISEGRLLLEAAKAVQGSVDTALREDLSKAVQEFERRSSEFFRVRGAEVIRDIKGIVDRTKSELERFETKAEMDDWLEFRFPQLNSRLGLIARDIPVEANEAYQAVAQARTQLRQLADEFEQKFKVQYAKVREVAAERTEAGIKTAELDIDGLIERLRGKEFSDRAMAEKYLSGSEARKCLEGELEVLAGSNPEAAKALRRSYLARVANALSDIERGGLSKVAKTGQQTVLLGETYFPKWEARVKEKKERKVSLIFSADPKTHGREIMGDVSLSAKGSDGETEVIRLYQDEETEDNWRFGLKTYRGSEVSASYVTPKEYKAVEKDYLEWSRKNSILRSKYEELREELARISETRVPRAMRDSEQDDHWQDQYKAKLKEYSEFVATHHIVLLKRIERVKSEPEIEHSNGKGYVPEWQSHWVSDRQTTVYLEEMAKAFNMQLELQEGLLNLKGHAGTGKDVLIKMFCSLTNRPYFAVDCTKWMTEFELSEDVMLEAEDGASKTIKVPSAVLNGISTPGAMVYFNEFNAMPEQAQIFLHALMDEKRSLTLKTSSGKVIRALPSVLLACSMNPGYPGTFTPQFATRSRMVSLGIDYPPLTRAAGEKDPNKNDVYDSSEALRMARQIDSLADMTFEANPDRNEFVKMWNYYVNGLNNGALEPTPIQKFDLDVILSVVQFADLLRGNFIKIFEQTREARSALPVSQPITGRELRRCAYAINQMSPAEKAKTNPEKVAKDLLERFYLTHIDKKEDRDKIKNAMTGWTSKKRVSK